MSHIKPFLFRLSAEIPADNDPSVPGSTPAIPSSKETGPIKSLPEDAPVEIDKKGSKKTAQLKRTKADEKPVLPPNQTPVQSPELSVALLDVADKHEPSESCPVACVPCPTRLKCSEPMPEPMHCVVEGSCREMELTVSATVDFCQRYLLTPTSLPDTCYVFHDTYVYQTRTHRSVHVQMIGVLEFFTFCTFKIYSNSNFYCDSNHKVN